MWSLENGSIEGAISQKGVSGQSTSRQTVKVHVSLRLPGATRSGGHCSAAPAESARFSTAEQAKRLRDTAPTVAVQFPDGTRYTRCLLSGPKHLPVAHRHIRIEIGRTTLIVPQDLACARFCSRSAFGSQSAASLADIAQSQKERSNVAIIQTGVVCAMGLPRSCVRLVAPQSGSTPGPPQSISVTASRSHRRP
jgi:hypothetical protein